MAVQNVVVEFLARTGGFRGGMNDIVNTTDRVNDAFNRVYKTAIAMSAAVVGSFYAASRQTGEFERNMRNVNSIVGGSEREFQNLSRTILELSTQVPQNANVLAQGAYEIASAGFTGTHQVTTLLEQSAKAATAGLTDTNTAARAIVTSLNAYQMTVSDAAHVSDVLFQTVNRGQLTFEDLAVNLGDFIGVARAAGASFEETLAAYANITIATGQSARAATNVQAIFRSLLNPTEAMTRAVKDLGHESVQTALAQEGLEGFLRQLTGSVNGNSEALYDLLGNVEAFQGVMALQAFTTEQAEENLSHFTDAMKISGATARAFNEQMKSSTTSFERSKNAMHAAAIVFGEVMLPVLRGISNVMGFFARQWLDLPEWVQDAIGALGLSIGTLFGVAAAVGLAQSKIYLIMRAINLLKGTALGSWLVSAGAQALTAAANFTIFGRSLAATNLSLVGLGRAAGIFGLVGAGVVALAGPVQRLVGLRSELDAMTESLFHLRSAGEVSGQLTESFGTNLEHLAGRIKDLNRTGIGRWVNAGYVAVAQEAINDLDDAIAKMVRSGNISGAQDLMDRLWKKAQEGGVTMDQFNYAMNDTRQALQEAESAGHGLVGTTEDLTGSQFEYTEAVLTASEATKVLQAVMDGLSIAQQGLVQALAAPTASLDGIINRIMESRRAAHEANRNLEDGGQGRGRSAAERAHDIASATLGIERAQMRLNDAQREYAELLRRGNAEQVSRAEERLVDARHDLEQATVRLQDAEESLAELRRGPTPRDIREAEIELARARDAQAEAIAGVEYQQKKLNAALDHGTPEEVAESERELAEAHLRAEEAAWRIEDAEKALNQTREGTPAKELRNAEREVASARREVAEAAKEQQQAERNLADARSGVEYAQDLREAQMNVREAVLALEGAHLQLAETQRERGERGSRKFREEIEKTQVTIRDFEDELRRSVQAHENWQENIRRIAERYGIAVATQLAKLGTDGAQLVDQLANATGEDAERMGRDLEKWALYGTGAFNAAVVSNLGKAKENARTLTREQVQAVAAELGVGYSDAIAILERYNLAVEQTAKAELRSVGPGQFRLWVPGKGFQGLVMEAQGGVLNAFKNGAESHVAQIAPAGAMRLWAEPETGGEAYIPLSPAKRKRSEMILESVADMFGMELHKYQKGGIAWPTPPTYGDFERQGIPWMMGIFGQRAARAMLAKAQTVGNAGLPGPTAPTGDLVSAGRYFQSLGFNVAEHPAFGGVRGRHTPTSYHYRGRAVDVNWYPAGEEPAKLTQLAQWIRNNLKYVELLWQVAGHYNHLHLAMAQGGILSYDEGGYLPQGLSVAYNGTGRPEPVGHGMGNTFNFDVDVEARISGDADLDKAAQLIRREVKAGIDEAMNDYAMAIAAGSRRRV